MKITIDTDQALLQVEETGAAPVSHALYTKEAFRILSLQWLRAGWALKQYHTFTWLGGPVLQLPEDLLRLQEVIVETKPDIILETGVYYGGSLIFYASLLELIGKGHVIGIDIEVRERTRALVANHNLSHRVTLLEGDSKSDEIAAEVRRRVAGAKSVMVILDADHRAEHVTGELRQYASLVTPGCWLVVTDTIMTELYDLPHAEASWKTDNPATSADEFARLHPEFERKQPPWAFNESWLSDNITYWPNGWFLRKPDAD